jgi:hypothetical protein
LRVGERAVEAERARAVAAAVGARAACLGQGASRVPLLDQQHFVARQRWIEKVTPLSVSVKGAQLTLHGALHLELTKKTDYPLHADRVRLVHVER